ncbi:MT0933-like antitoxin protein [Jatrophihabitans endophyticus]|uniref:MT0933-like antitoxin protein n=1 Tax=Jatrophihabitans endophyticus TaxID=1206085 RepID=A0A1M5HPT2_9ACTN|nr:Rv0909 family putative TA system antitoxin [Jatrophihabitans endophyticus]SHG17963.1 MT0933-like antitoxin protein [Jatrophihabitans endophyticus]
MDTRGLRARADDMLRKHGGTIDKGVSGAERFAKKRAKGKERQVEQAANRVRGLLDRKPPAQ